MTAQTVNPLDNLSPDVRQKYQEAVDISLSKITTLNSQTLEKLRQRFRNRENVSKQEIFQSLPNPGDPAATKALSLILEDLTRKSMGSLDRVKAQADWAIGFIWKTRLDKKVVGNPAGEFPTVSDPTVHGNHYEREGKFYVFRDSPAVKDGFIAARGDVMYADQLIDGMPSVPAGCRCIARYVYSLKSVPKEILTKKGEAFINKL